MAANKRNKFQQEADWRFISELLVVNTPIRQITIRLNAARLSQNYQLSYQQVHADIKKVIRIWREEREEFITDRIYIELAKIDKMEAECWEEWYRSKTSRQKTKIEGGDLQDGQITKGKVKERETSNSFGDTRYMDVIDRCVDKRIKLLGLYAPIKVENSIAGNNIENMSREEIEKRIADWRLPDE